MSVSNFFRVERLKFHGKVRRLKILILKINALLPNFLPSLLGLQFEDISYMSRTFTMGDSYFQEVNSAMMLDSFHSAFSEKYDRQSKFSDDWGCSWARLGRAKACLGPPI